MESGLPSFTRSFTSSVLLWNTGITQDNRFRLRDYHPLRSLFPERSANAVFLTANRCPQPHKASFVVWADPLSLAATNGVSLDFFSCRYLDVSVPCVRPTWPMHSAMGERIWLPSPDGFPHSEIPGLTDARLLPRAYRSLPRPSSPLDTKTSPIHS